MLSIGMATPTFLIVLVASSSRWLVQGYLVGRNNPIDINPRVHVTPTQFLLAKETTRPLRLSGRLTGKLKQGYPSLSSKDVVVCQAHSSSQDQNHELSPIELWCTSKIDQWYTKSLSIKCPFWKRRMSDLLDGMDVVMRFLIIRHKSLDIIGPPPGCRCSKSMSPVKRRNLPIEDVLELIRCDWTGKRGGDGNLDQNRKQDRGYYITGRLNTAIYRDDCMFDGPDPDMPVRGLRKYLSAASQLFDQKQSRAELLSLEIADRNREGIGATQVNAIVRTLGEKAYGKGNRDGIDMTHGRSVEKVIVATWKLEGVLHLPWKPTLPVWTGTTTYFFDEQGTEKMPATARFLHLLLF